MDDGDSSWLPPAGEGERLHVSDRFINKLKEMVRDNVECPICFTSFATVHGTAVLLKCGHITCSGCYCTWVAFRPDTSEPAACHFCRAIMDMVLGLPIPRPGSRSITGLPYRTFADEEDNQPARADAAENEPPQTGAAEGDQPAQAGAAEDDEPAGDDEPADAEDDGNAAD